MAGRVGLGLGDAERLVGGDLELIRHEVTAGHELRDGMLDLDPGVHLEEEPLAAIGEEELAGSGALVADLGCEAERRFRERPAGRRVHRGRRRFLEDLLMPALDRAVPLAEVDAMAVPVEQDLDLDVARALHELLRINRSSPKAAAASRRAAASPMSRPARSLRTRIPLPPPPAAGFTSNG